MRSRPAGASRRSTQPRLARTRADSEVAGLSGESGIRATLRIRMRACLRLPPERACSTGLIGRAGERTDSLHGADRRLFPERSIAPAGSPAMENPPARSDTDDGQTNTPARR